MVSKTACRRCGRLGNFNEVKLYPLPHDPSQSMFLCEACYRKMLFEKNREKVQTKPCHQCGRVIPVDARLCPYCGVPLRSESLRGSRRLETMCGFCGARFVGTPTVCPSCGKRIMQVPANQDFTWAGGKRVTTNMLLLVVLIVGVVVGAIIINMYMNSLPFINASSNGSNGADAINFTMTDCRVINHNGQTGVHVIFDSNTAGEIRISNANQVVGHTLFSSSDASKIVDLGNIWDTLGFTPYSVLVICKNEEVFSHSYLFGAPSFMINGLNITWAFENDTLKDVMTNLQIKVSQGGDSTTVNAIGVNIVIDMVNGPYRINFPNGIEAILPLETRSINITPNIPSVFHRETHQVSISLVGIQSQIIFEYIGDFRV